MLQLLPPSEAIPFSKTSHFFKIFKICKLTRLKKNSASLKTFVELVAFRADDTKRRDNDVHREMFIKNALPIQIEKASDKEQIFSRCTDRTKTRAAPPVTCSSPPFRSNGLDRLSYQG
ncbi:hypothetical protein DICVIV_12988 [Dictyocaulus viviparus]|uniref:Uncharacterized protein n=1 Tax=Dictyocaulus viviparus TaxID=29172 RepID=A0A0D8XF22_DICVI|nr:hypothetical protein DICVIV_12988 [Dictyocaulus viviparus]